MKELPIESRQALAEKQKISKSNLPLLLQNIRESEFGYNLSLKTPFGIKPLIYADYTASARSLKFIENYIENEVLPSYANTHSESSACAMQTHYLREESRGILKRCVNASEKDVAIFVGSGFTGAINLLIRAMNLKDKNSLNAEEEQKNFCYANRWGSYDCILCHMPFYNKGLYQDHEKSAIHQEKLCKLKTEETKSEKKEDKIVIFTSIFEHHSNILPWREMDAVIEIIPIDEKNGDLNYKILSEKLLLHKDAKFKIGTFSGCSNITGICPNVDLISYILHKNNAIAIFDMTAYAPYLKLDMNQPVNSFEISKSQFPDLVSQKDFADLSYKDAMLFSGHKFIGGPGSTGVLVAKRDLFKSVVPSNPGGGTVLYVNKNEHAYIAAIEQREEGGTPAIIESIRLGLVMQLKEAIGEDFIEKREQDLINIANLEFQKMKNVILLDTPNFGSLKKIPIFSLNIKSHGKLLHFNFVVKLLNDLFGIQSRGGCACAAVYGLDLLGVPVELSNKYNEAIGKGYEILRLGFVRINFAYWMTDECVKYILNSINWISEYGWMILPYYTFDTEKNIWNIRLGEEEVKRTWLHKINYTEGKMNYPKGSGKFIINEKPIDLSIQIKNMNETALEVLKKTIDEYKYIYGKAKLDQDALFPDQELKDLRWFLLPSEILDKTREISDNFKLVNSYKEFSPIKLPFKCGHQFDKIEPPEIKIEEKTSEIVKQENEEEFIFPTLAEPEPTIKKNKPVYAEIPEKVLKLVGEAIQDFDMIHEKDRILVCVSGGKDSLSLLHILLNLQARSPVKFDLGVVTVDPQTPQYNPEPLNYYVTKLGVPYYLESHSIVEKAKTSLQNDSICAFCSRMRRGVIYQCARRNKYNVIALGQHLDDLAESFMMSVLHNGKLRTMKANYLNDKGDVRVIRPLVYCREKFFKEISETEKLPIIVDNCPACFSAPKERHRIKLMLAQQEHVFPTIFSSLLQSMKPLMTKKEGEKEDPDEMNF